MLQFKPADIDLVALCRDCAREAEETSTNRHKPRLEMEIAAEIGQAFGDDKLLRHVLGNLLSNAFKYSPSGGTVRFSARRENRDIVFRVSDEGIGIPAGELPRLFESFQRAENVGNIQGTGLGLAIVKKSVELHGGTIEVGSEVGRGSCFTVRVPDACGDNG
jgi:signal transduction histidine kinase